MLKTPPYPFLFPIIHIDVSTAPTVEKDDTCLWVASGVCWKKIPPPVWGKASTKSAMGQHQISHGLSPNRCCCSNQTESGHQEEFFFRNKKTKLSSGNCRISSTFNPDSRYVLVPTCWDWASKQIEFWRKTTISLQTENTSQHILNLQCRGCFSSCCFFFFLMDVRWHSP